MTIRKRMALPLALAVGALGMLVMASVANATHPRPKSASPISASMVPAYNACTAPNRTHGPPLAFPSCNPPTQSSTSLTVGSPDANGAGANSVGSIKIKVVVGVPGPPEDSDVILQGSVSDVRCLPGNAACGSANAAAGPDYTGEIQTTATIRITDHWNAVAPGGGTDPATVVDIPFPVNTTCTATGSTATGSNCATNTTANAVVPGAVKDGKRAIVETGQIQTLDGGTDGVVATSPNTLFAVQGIFIP
jgi:hypothetical protein